MSEKKGIGFFERYLTVWVAICIIVGIAVGKFLPSVPAFLSQFEYASVSLPITILIWLMIYPMMLKVDFSSLFKIQKSSEGLAITTLTNWLIKPFSMFGIAYLFFYVIYGSLLTPEQAEQYLSGAVLLGAAPCTAMVFVWSYLTKGNATYTLVQVALNDLIILIAFVPIVGLLLGLNGVVIPWDTLILSVILFVILPLGFAILTRNLITKRRGADYYNNVFVKKFNSSTIIGLLLTLVILFSFQGDKILDNPFHILLIAVPLIIQTFFIFFFAYSWARKWKLSHDIASPSAMIGASNFFELAVAVAIALFGLDSGAALATVVGVLVEVPVMLFLVKISNRTKKYFIQ